MTGGGYCLIWSGLKSIRSIHKVRGKGGQDTLNTGYCNSPSYSWLTLICEVTLAMLLASGDNAVGAARDGARVLCCKSDGKREAARQAAPVHGAAVRGLRRPLQPSAAPGCDPMHPLSLHPSPHDDTRVVLTSTLAPILTPLCHGIARHSFRFLMNHCSGLFCVPLRSATD